MDLINKKIIEIYKNNIDSNYNHISNKNLIKFKLNEYFINDKIILDFINNDAQILLQILNKCYQYDNIYQNNLKNIFFEYMNIIYSEHLRNIS